MEFPSFSWITIIFIMITVISRSGFLLLICYCRLSYSTGGPGETDKSTSHSWIIVWFGLNLSHISIFILYPLSHYSALAPSSLSLVIATPSSQPLGSSLYPWICLICKSKPVTFLMPRTDSNELESLGSVALETPLFQTLPVPSNHALWLVIPRRGYGFHASLPLPILFPLLSTSFSVSFPQ